MQRQHDERQRRRKIECGRGQERDTQHAHGAPAQFVRRRGQRVRLGLRLAVQHDGGDAAHAVEETRLQPRQSQELVARGGGGADACRGHRDRDQQAAQNQHKRADRIGQQRSDGHQQRAGNRQRRGRQPARESPSSASIRSTTIAVSSPVWCVRSRAGPACSRRDSASVRSRRRAAAPALKAPRSAAIDAAARSMASTAKPPSSAPVSSECPVRAPASSIATHQAWPTAIAVFSRPSSTTGHTARPPMRRSSRSQARDAVLLSPDCILPPA